MVGEGRMPGSAMEWFKVSRRRLANFLGISIRDQQCGERHVAACLPCRNARAQPKINFGPNSVIGT